MIDDFGPWVTGPVFDAVLEAGHAVLAAVLASPVLSAVILMMAVTCGAYAQSLSLFVVAIVLGVLHLMLLRSGVEGDPTIFSYASLVALVLLTVRSFASRRQRRQQWSERRAQRAEIDRLQALLDQEIRWRRAAEPVDAEHPGL